MDVEHLVNMANDIGNYFSSDPDRATGVAGMVDHIERFWEPRMRKQIGAHLEAGGEGLSDIARAAIIQLEAQRSAA
jgi:formate dehydrogenase subunit delta